MIPKSHKDWRLYAKYSGFGFIVAGAIGNIYQGFNYTVLGLYILGVSFVLMGVLNK